MSTLIPHIPTLVPCIPTLIPSIPTMISCIPIPIPRISTLNFHIPRNPNIPTPVLRIPTLIPRVPTLISCVPIIPLIPFSDSPFQLLQIAWNLSLFLIFIESSFPGEKNGNGKVHFVILGANWNLPLYKNVWKIWLSEYFWRSVGISTGTFWVSGSG